MREALRLLGGGHFLQQPMYVDDLAKVALAFLLHGVQLVAALLTGTVGWVWLLLERRQRGKP